MNEYLTPKQLADFLQLTERTLANQRSEGRGIPFVKIEKAVRYRAADVEAYLAGVTETTRGSELGEK